MSLIDTIERTSFKKIFWAALLFGVLLTVPVTVYLIQTETRLFSSADFKPPSMPELKRGQAPKIAPKISSIAPFLGKEGDIVILIGKNFGYYPVGASLKVGRVIVPEDHLVSWEDTKIAFYIPTISKSGKISLNTGSFFITWPKILTVYTPNETTKITKKANSLNISHALNVARVVYYGPDGKRYEERLTRPLTNGPEPETLVKKLQTNNPSWITLFDLQNIAIPFYVNPADFGF